MIRITWYGHSCFRIESQGHSIVIDPYTGVPGHPDLHVRAGLALKSHDHADHSFLEAVEIVEEAGESPFHISSIDCWHDDQGGRLRGSNRITIIEAEGIRIAHFGDVGEVLAPSVLDQLKGLDAALIPVGGFFTIDGVQAAELMTAIDPVVTIPMHYRWNGHGYNEISEITVFTDQVQDRPVIHSEETGIDIGKGTNEKSVVILSCEGPDA